MSTVAQSLTDKFEIAGRVFSSRLVVGTGKYRTFDEMKAAHRASGAEMVTVAVRRVHLDRREESFLDHLDTSLTILPNTAGCYTAEEAINTARLAREGLDTDLVKLEVIGDQTTLFPDNEQTLQAARVLVGEGFTVLPYFTDDLIVAKKLLDAGCAAVMPLAADGVLMNTAIAEARDAEQMATAMRLAVEAGRRAYLAGRMPKRLYASASSPLAGVIK